MAPVFKISDFGMGKKLPETDPDLQDPYVNDLNTHIPPPLIFSSNISVTVDFFCAQMTLLTNWYCIGIYPLQYEIMGLAANGQDILPIAGTLTVMDW